VYYMEWKFGIYSKYDFYVGLIVAGNKERMWSGERRWLGESRPVSEMVFDLDGKFRLCVCIYLSRFYKIDCTILLSAVLRTNCDHTTTRLYAICILYIYIQYIGLRVQKCDTGE